MLDGRIDTQGSVKDIQNKGLLDIITHESSTESPDLEQEVVESSGESKTSDKVEKPAKVARKLVQEEERESGGVKWEIYKTYLRAS